MTTNATAAVLHEPEAEFLLEDVILDDNRADKILVKSREQVSVIQT